MHREYNALGCGDRSHPTDSDFAGYPGIEPSYEHKHFDLDDRRSERVLVASQDGTHSFVRIRRNAAIHAEHLTLDGKARPVVADGRHAWVQIVRGARPFEWHTDGRGRWRRSLGGIGGNRAEVEVTDSAEILVFDLNEPQQHPARFGIRDCGA